MVLEKVQEYNLTHTRAAVTSSGYVCNLLICSGCFKYHRDCTLYLLRNEHSLLLLQKV